MEDLTCVVNSFHAAFPVTSFLFNTFVLHDMNTDLWKYICINSFLKISQDSRLRQTIEIDLGFHFLDGTIKVHGERDRSQSESK